MYIFKNLTLNTYILDSYLYNKQLNLIQIDQLNLKNILFRKNSFYFILFSFYFIQFIYKNTYYRTQKRSNVIIYIFEFIQKQFTANSKYDQSVLWTMLANINKQKYIKKQPKIYKIKKKGLVVKRKSIDYQLNRKSIEDNYMVQESYLFPESQKLFLKVKGMSHIKQLIQSEQIRTGIKLSYKFCNLNKISDKYFKLYVFCLKCPKRSRTILSFRWHGQKKPTSCFLIDVYKHITTKQDRKIRNLRTLKNRIRKQREEQDSRYGCWIMTLFQNLHNHKDIKLSNHLYNEKKFSLISQQILRHKKKITMSQISQIMKVKYNLTYSIPQIYHVYQILKAEPKFVLLIKRYMVQQGFIIMSNIHIFDQFAQYQRKLKKRGFNQLISDYQKILKRIQLLESKVKLRYKNKVKLSETQEKPAQLVDKSNQQSENANQNTKIQQTKVQNIDQQVYEDQQIKNILKEMGQYKSHSATQQREKTSYQDEKYRLLFQKQKYWQVVDGQQKQSKAEFCMLKSSVYKTLKLDSQKIPKQLYSKTLLNTYSQQKSFLLLLHPIFIKNYMLYGRALYLKVIDNVIFQEEQDRKKTHYRQWSLIVGSGCDNNSKPVFFFIAIAQKTLNQQNYNEQLDMYKNVELTLKKVLLQLPMQPQVIFTAPQPMLEKMIQKLKQQKIYHGQHLFDVYQTLKIYQKKITSIVQKNFLQEKYKEDRQLSKLFQNKSAEQIIRLYMTWFKKLGRTKEVSQYQSIENQAYSQIKQKQIKMILHQFLSHSDKYSFTKINLLEPDKKKDFRVKHPFIGFPNEINPSGFIDSIIQSIFTKFASKKQKKQMQKRRNRSEKPVQFQSDQIIQQQQYSQQQISQQEQRNCNSQNDQVSPKKKQSDQKNKHIANEQSSNDQYEFLDEIQQENKNNVKIEHQKQIQRRNAQESQKKQLLKVEEFQKQISLKKKKKQLKFSLCQFYKGFTFNTVLYNILTFSNKFINIKNFTQYQKDTYNQRWTNKYIQFSKYEDILKIPQLRFIRYKVYKHPFNKLLSKLAETLWIQVLNQKWNREFYTEQNNQHQHQHKYKLSQRKKSYCFQTNNIHPQQNKFELYDLRTKEVFTVIIVKQSGLTYSNLSNNKIKRKYNHYYFFKQVPYTKTVYKCDCRYSDKTGIPCEHELKICLMMKCSLYAQLSQMWKVQQLFDRNMCPLGKPKKSRRNTHMG